MADDNEIIIVYKCPCNNRDYPSKASLLAHKKTKMHKNWESTREQRELKKDLTKKDNKILALETTVTRLRQLNNILIERISDLKKQIETLKGV